MPKRRIVVGIDFSPASARALEAAAGLAEDLGAELVLVHAWDVLPRVSEASAFLAGAAGLLHEAVSTAEVDDAVALSADVAQALRRRGLEVQVVAQERPAADLLLAAAQETQAQLIVLGRRGGSGLRRLGLGGVAHAVLRRSTRPVLVVPSPEDAGGEGPAEGG